MWLNDVSCCEEEKLNEGETRYLLVCCYCHFFGLGVAFRGMGRSLRCYETSVDRGGNQKEGPWGRRIGGLRIEVVCGVLVKDRIYLQRSYILSKQDVPSS
jgi:hypothetical protein